MAINFNDYKERLKLILDGTDGVDEIVIGSPYFDEMSGTREGTLYITTRGTSPDNITLNSTVNDNGHVSLEHELRINLIIVKSGTDSRDAEELVDTTVYNIMQVLENNASLSHGVNAGIAEISYPESVDSRDFGSSKTARIITVKIIRNS